MRRTARDPRARRAATGAHARTGSTDRRRRRSKVRPTGRRRGRSRKRPRKVGRAGMVEPGAGGRCGGSSAWARRRRERRSAWRPTPHRRARGCGLRRHASYRGRAIPTTAERRLLTRGVETVGVGHRAAAAPLGRCVRRRRRRVGSRAARLRSSPTRVDVRERGTGPRRGCGSPLASARRPRERPSAARSASCSPARGCGPGLATPRRTWVFLPQACAGDAWLGPAARRELAAVPTADERGSRRIGAT